LFPLCFNRLPKAVVRFPLIAVCSKFSIAGIYKTAFSNENNPSQFGRDQTARNQAAAKPLAHEYGPYISIAAKRTLWFLSS